MTDKVVPLKKNQKPKSSGRQGSRADQVSEKIREAIRHGKYTSGDHIRETEVAEWLQVSRTPVREALRRLESEGLLTFESWRGVVVANLDRQQISELWPATSGAYQRLYAMGVDAYLLIPWLRYLQLNPEEHLRGETGNLFLDVQNRVHRQLLWARLSKGRPQLLESGH